MIKQLIGIIVGAALSVWGLILFLPANQIIGKTGRYTWKPPYSDYEQAALNARFYGILLLVTGLLIMIIFAVFMFIKKVKSNKEK